MADSDAASRNPNDWPSQGVRQRLGSRIERHVLRSAVDMLDERGADLDTIERELVKREQDLAERLAVADNEEAQVAYREQRLAEIGAQDVDATRKIDHLVRQLDETEAAAAALRAKAQSKVLAAEDKARELAERVKRLEEAEHRRVLSAADITRRESALRTREHELRQQDERLREREQALGAKQHNLIVLEQALQRREREVEEREDSIRRQGRRWWGAGPASSPFGE
jgi:chromosome segregation ATPase